MESLIGLLFFGGIIYYFFAKFTAGGDVGVVSDEDYTYEEKGSSFIPKSDYIRDIEAKEIAKSVKTHRGLEGLQNKINALSDKMDEYHFNEKELMYEKTEEKQSIMEMALDYAYVNPYRYYYEVDPDVDTTLLELNMIGKTISVKKYNELDEFTRAKYSPISLEEVENVEEANEIAKDNVLVEEDEFKDLFNYRKIIESDETEEDKEKKFNKLVSKSEFLMDELYLDEDEGGSLYDQYKYIKIMDGKIKKLEPLPHANFFVNNGYEGIEIISALSDEEIRSIEGIGSKRLSEIRKYLDGIKTFK